MVRILCTLGCILGVILLIVLGLLVFIHLLLIPRIGVHVWAKDGTFRVKARYGKLLVLVFPRPKKEKKAKKPKEPKSPKEKTPKPVSDKPKRKLNIWALDWGDTICWVLDLLLQMKNTLRLDIVRSDITLATGNAAKTGKLLGQLSMWVSIVYAFLMEHFNLKTCHIAVDGDFEGSKTVYDAEVSLSLRLIVLEWVIVRNLPKLYQIYKTLMKTEAETT